MPDAAPGPGEVLTNEKERIGATAVIVRLWVFGVLTVLFAYGAYIGTVYVNNSLATALGLLSTVAVPVGVFTLLVAAIATGVRVGLRR